MTIEKTEAIPYRVKYCLIAHEKGMDYYVVATERGNLMACGGGSVESFRVSESLITFEEMARNVLREQEHLEEEGMFPPGSARERFVRQMTYFLEDALLYLGFPPKEKVEFFSLPSELVASLRWTPRRSEPEG